jgi:hypothetical protein
MYKNNKNAIDRCIRSSFLALSLSNGLVSRGDVTGLKYKTPKNNTMNIVSITLSAHDVLLHILIYQIIIANIKTKLLKTDPGSLKHSETVTSKLCPFILLNSVGNMPINTQNQITIGRKGSTTADGPASPEHCPVKCRIEVSLPILYI